VTELSGLSYRLVISALKRAGFVVVRQRGSHIRLHKRTRDKVIKVTVPAHASIKKGTLIRIIKDAGLTIEEFKELLS
jgi:predicted RNA binding protein YcfA (HicA-like mRNA interferase family)